MRAKALLLSTCVGCGDDPAKAAVTVLPAEDTGIPHDPAATDTADTSEAADTTDTADTATEPCSEGLVVRLSGEEIDSEVDLGESPARAWTVGVTLELHNPCDDDLRFLGHPDEWVSGAAFSLESLPPVRLSPGESASLSIAFSPGDPGLENGQLTLPYDQLGSPFDVSLRGTAGEPLPLVLAGEGRRVSTTPDYGATFSTDSWDTLEAHTNALQRGGCFGVGTFVTVGGDDSMRWWTSPDGDTWTAHVAAGSAIGDCAFGDGRFVAFASGLLTSADGIDWTHTPLDWVPDHLRAMAHGVDATGAHRFVAVGDNGRVAVTLDGTAWQSDANPVSDSLNEVGFGVGTAGPVWVAVGDSGVVATSPDGESWTEQVVGSGRGFSSVVYGDSQFLIGDGSALYGSLDGYSWSLVGASTVHPLAQLGQMWFGTAGASIFRSDDAGLSWTELRPDDGGPGYATAMFARDSTEGDR